MAIPQRNIKKLFGQSSHYVIGTALATCSHLVTFPIYTRIFSVADYGILSLISVTISTVLAISKLGLTNSSIRMFEECHAESRTYTSGNYYSTFFFTVCIIGSALSLLYALFVRCFSGLLFDSVFSSLLLFSALIVCSRTVNAILMSFLRAEQRTKLFNALTVLFVYSGSALSIFLVLFLIKGLWGFYTGQLVVECCSLVILYRLLRKRVKLRIKDFSMDLLVVSIKFGLPMIALEFLNHILTFGDRFLINIFCGPEALGIYSVGYNLSSYVSNILLVPMSFAVTPLLMQIWVRDGKEATQNFLSNSLNYITLFFFPVLAGFIAVGNEVLMLLASAKYQEANTIIPFAVLGVGFYALSNVLNAGLIIEKRTDKILLHSFIATVLNVVLNLVLIPRTGIIGAAIATFISYGVFFISISVSSYLILPFRINYGKIGLYFILSLLMAFTTTLIKIDNVLVSLVLKILCGMVVYALLLSFFDNEILRIAIRFIKSRTLNSTPSDDQTV